MNKRLKSWRTSLLSSSSFFSSFSSFSSDPTVVPSTVVVWNGKPQFSLTSKFSSYSIKISAQTYWDAAKKGIFFVLSGNTGTIGGIRPFFVLRVHGQRRESAPIEKSLLRRRRERRSYMDQIERIRTSRDMRKIQWMNGQEEFNLHKSQGFTHSKISEKSRNL